MAADFFEVKEDGTVFIRPEAKKVPEIEALILKHKSSSINLTKEVQYIWHVTSSKSPYEGYYYSAGDCMTDDKEIQKLYKIS